MCSSLWENVLTLSALHSMRCSFYLDTLRERRQLANKLLIDGVLLPGFVQNSTYKVHIKLFPQVFY